jgi:hypothetical protein
MNGYFAKDDDFDDYPDSYEDDDRDDEWEDALEECGQLPKHLGGGCQLAGTEYCDFECPFRDQPIEEDEQE